MAAMIRSRLAITEATENAVLPLLRTICPTNFLQN